MNVKKLVSSVAAFAMTASVFAGVATTASALEPGDYTATVSPVAQNRITKNADGTFTTARNAGNQYALALADLSGIEDISKATSVTVEFDTVNAGRFLVGIGDKDTRGTTAGTSSKGTYDTNGLIMRFGTDDGKYYRVNGGTNNSAAMGATVHATVTLDRKEKKYSYTLKNGETTLFTATDVATDITNLTVIEAYTWLSNATFTMSDVSVRYTIPDVPQVNYTLNAVDADNNVLVEGIVNGSANQNSTIDVSGIPEVVKSNDKYYVLDDAEVLSYKKSLTLGSTETTGTVRYKNDSNIVYFAEGESFAKDIDGNYSGGATGFMAGTNDAAGYKKLGSFDPGVYEVTIILKDRGDRGLYIRNADVDNTAENVLINYETTRSSAAGAYTKELTLTEKTTLGFTGFSTSGSTTKVNQSANYDYIVIKKIGEYEAPKTLPEVTVAEGAVYDEAGSTPAKVFTGTFTVGENNISVKAIDWKVTVGDKVGEATSTFDAVITNIEVVTGLVVEYADAANLTAENVTATCVAAAAPVAE